MRRLSVVVQRYGTEVLGGSESHARQVVERLAADYEVEVLTTCAQDYGSWENVYPPGETRVNGIPVRRFPTIAPRRADFGALSARRFGQPNRLAEELEWLQAQGPWVPALLDHLEAEGRTRDALIFFTYIYYPTALGLPRVAERALLVPTAHDEPAIRFDLYRWLFHAPRAILFNTEEERRFVHGHFGNAHIPNDVVGLGVALPRAPEPERLRQQLGLDGPYALYLGRITPGKGCDELLEFYRRYREQHAEGITLLLMGKQEMTLPDLPGLRYGGFVGDEDKFDALAGATALIVPSRYESLSMIALEAWTVGRPVLCTAHSEVVRGLCLRSNGGLFYEDAATFAEALHLLATRPDLASALGRQGQRFVASQYSWEGVLAKYRRFIEMVVAEPWR